MFLLLQNGVKITWGYKISLTCLCLLTLIYLWWWEKPISVWNNNSTCPIGVHLNFCPAAGNQMSRHMQVLFIFTSLRNFSAYTARCLQFSRYIFILLSKVKKNAQDVLGKTIPSILEFCALLVVFILCWYVFYFLLLSVWCQLFL